MKESLKKFLPQAQKAHKVRKYQVLLIENQKWADISCFVLAKQNYAYFYSISFE